MAYIGHAGPKSNKKPRDLRHTRFVRRIVPAVAAAVVAAGVVCGSASSGQSSRAQLRLMTSSPVTLRGTGFMTGEHVRVVGRFPGMAAKHVTASSAGSFTVRFTGFAGTRCTGLSVTATGDRGSRASFTRLPEQCGALP
jgi:hypothetical protein